ncbi:MAG: ABC transporter ATP-binding protein [archaeon]|nr:ABC transporter ATP-binding protein [archaeon]MCP8314852.1 ABC transporter ATP-binding protein [archaeon]
MDIAIETKGLSKSFGRIKAVDRLDLKVEVGTVHGFLGPNGAGKTTTIKLILGLLKPDSGSIQVLGFDGGGRKIDVRSRIGYMPELPKLPPFLKGREILEIYGEIYGLSSMDRLNEAKRLLELVGLSDRANDRIGHYSKGMQQRLGLAQALIGDPDLVILDEPSLGLDPVGMVEVREIIRKIASEGRPVFLSSHLLNEVQQVCSHATVINRGMKIIEGSIPNLLEKLSKPNEVIVELERVSPDVMKAIRSLSFVEKVNWVGNKAEIFCSKPSDFRADLSRAISDSGGLIIGMRVEERSLEELFLELVKGGS